jgi:hypothetical protein
MGLAPGEQVALDVAAKRGGESRVAVEVFKPRARRFERPL